MYLEGIFMAGQVMNIFYLTRNILSDRNTVIDFCIENRLIPTEKRCVSCRKQMHFRNSSACKGIAREWRCMNKGCRRKNHSVSARNGTWFSESKLSIEKILLTTLCFVEDLSNKLAIRQTSIEEEKTSSETICDWYTYCMEVCCEIVASRSNPIGGPGMTVEIDEAKFGKRKYNRGRFIEGQWVLGGICRETKECFFVPVQCRNRETLIPIIIQNVLPGSTIITDCWRAYNILSLHDFTHLTVNHSINFIDPTTGAYTQTIESQWWQIKRRLPPTHTAHGRLNLFLGRYIFNKISAASGLEPFTFFIQCISNMQW